MMICSICKSPQVYTSTKSKTYCLRCHSLKNAPVLFLTKRWRSNLWYNPSTGKTIANALAYLEACQFKLYIHTVYYSEEKNPSYEEIMMLRYYGYVACNQIANHNWEPNRQKCKAINCP